MNQSSKELSPFQRGQVDFLKREVNRWIDESLKRDADSDAAQRLFHARRELKRYVEELRTIGKLI
jgi:hypothetical protein